MNEWWILIFHITCSGKPPVCTPSPQFPFRGATSIRDCAIQSEYRGQTRKDPCLQRHVYENTANSCAQNINLNDAMGNVLDPTTVQTANCRGVVYLLFCKSGSFYVGKMMVGFWRCAYRHIKSMRVWDPELPLGQHRTKIHGDKFPKM